jgi:thioredoxin 1
MSMLTTERAKGHGQDRRIQPFDIATLKGHFMKRSWKIVILALTAAIAIGSITTYLFTIGPFGKPVLATVNGKKILVAGFRQDLEKVDPAYRDLVREDPGKLLDILINKAVLLQEAKREGVTAPKGEGAIPPVAGPDAETLIITTYLEKKMAALPPAPPEEVDRIYEAYKDQLVGRKKEEATALIRQMIEQRRQGEEAEKLIADLRKGAKIDVNQKELQKLAIVPSGMETQSESNFRKALTGGKPMVVDFGSNSCIPCRQLRPVLQKVRKDYEGKLEVLIIEIQKNQQLAAEYQIQVMPTVVFIDRAGKVVFRHQGFMSEEKIKEQLAKMGVV